MSEDLSIQKTLKKLQKTRKSRKAVEIDNLTPLEKKAIQMSSAGNQTEADAGARMPRGIGCARLVEAQPRFNRASCEKVFKGPNNSYIVLGRDRPRSIFSGYGGMGYTGAGHLDLVVGRMSHNPQTRTEKGDLLYADPDFEMDAARIYISQKSDIDANLGIENLFIPGFSEGGRGKDKVDSPSTVSNFGRSGIAIKADEVRIVGREDIKLVTGTDAKNSLGGKIDDPGGIFLVAGDASKPGEEVEPFVKGDTLIEMLSGLLEEINQLRTTVYGFIDQQHKFNLHVKNHVHHSPFFGKPTLPSKVLLTTGQKVTSYHMDNSMMGLDKIGGNLEVLRDGYLKPSAARYICSRHHKLN